MQQVKITVSVSDGFFQRYKDEARREGVKVEDLVQQTHRLPHSQGDS